MKKNLNIYSLFIAFVLALAVVTSCGSKEKNPNARTDTYSSGSISFGADESLSPIIEEEMDVFHAIYPKAHVTPEYMTEGEGMEKLVNEKILMMFTTRDFNQKELEVMKSRDRKYFSFHCGYDGLALIAHKSNTDSCMSVKNVKAILNGDIKEWKEINPKSPLGKVIVCFDTKGSSAVHFVEDSILGGKPIGAANVFATKKTKDVIEYVEKTPGAIGIIGSNWLNDRRDTLNLTWKKNIRVLAISTADEATPQNSYKPYQGYIYYDNYPFIRKIYCLLNDGRGRYGLPHGFAQFVISNKGQMIIFKAGLLPAYGNIAVRDIQINTD